jgi:hypothetical protein
MTHALLLFLALAAAIAAAPARAALYTWNTTGSISPGSGTACAGGAACKTTFTSTSGNQTLTARAYSTPVYDTTSPYDVSGKWIEGRIALYSGGLGVANLVGSDSSSELNAPEHAVDNEGAKDIVVFELPTDGSWNPESFKLGWMSTDSDVQAWVGGGSLGANYDFRNVCFSGSSCTTLSSLGFVDISAGIPVVSGGTQSAGGASVAGGENVPTNASAMFNTTQTGRYLIMSGALNEANDYFKISQIVAGRVPVPATLVLLATGLLALRVRRNRLSV